MKRQGINRKSALVFLLLFVATCAVILYFKAASDKAAQGSAANPSLKNVGPMARPDTTVTSDVRSDIADTAHIAAPDTLERDPRPADEAGAEDGYWDGYYDGVAGKPMNEHDTSSNFPTSEERQTYASNYSEGYKRGYAEGNTGKEAQ